MGEEMAIKLDLSIAILFCNKAEQTIECLQSFVSPSIIRDVHVLDNGSDLQAAKIVKDFCEENRVNYYRLPKNLGVAVGRNYLIKQTKSEWIFFVDNDITLEHNKHLLEDDIEEAIANNPEALAFAPKLFNVHLNAFENFYSFSVHGNKAVTYVSKNGESNKLSGGACIINRKLFDINGLYNEQFFVGFEDFEFCLRAIKAGRDLKVIELPHIQLNHNHKKVTTGYDNDYLQTRYNAEKIEQSYKLIQKLHGLTLPDNGVSWSQKKINQMSNKSLQEESKPTKSKNTRITLYHDNQVGIGGIETFNRNWCKRLSPYYDITFLCKNIDAEHAIEIGAYADIVMYTGQEIETDIFIYGVSWGVRPEKVKAKAILQMLHGDFEWMQKDLHFTYKPMPGVTGHIAVGQNVADKFKKVTGMDATVIYNLLDLDVKPTKLLKIISVMRLGREKGLERMEIMARKFKEAGVKFRWLVYGDGTDKAFVKQMKSKFEDLPEVVFAGVKKSTVDEVADADYLVALSKSEGFSYSIYEALKAGTPCIVTNFPSAYEQVEDGVNGFILDMKLSNLNVEKITSSNLKGFKFVEKSTEKDWINVLGGDGKIVNKTPKKTKLMAIKIIRSYNDLREKKRMKIGETISVLKPRGLELIGKRLAVAI